MANATIPSAIKPIINYPFLAIWLLQIEANDILGISLKSVCSEASAYLLGVIVIPSNIQIGLRLKKEDVVLNCRAHYQRCFFFDFLLVYGRYFQIEL